MTMVAECAVTVVRSLRMLARIWVLQSFEAEGIHETTLGNEVASGDEGPGPINGQVQIS